MATAKDNPTLVIDIEFNDKDAKKRSDAYFKEEQRKALSFSNEQKRTAQKTEADVTAIKSKEQAKALAQKQRLETLAQAKLSAQAQAGELKKEQAISLMQAKELERRRIAYERQMQRIAQGHTTWSQKMVKGIEGIGMSIKGLALAWASAQLGGAIKGALELAGGMGDAAAGVQLTTQQYFALTSALRDAGVQAEKIDMMFTRINDLVSGGASEKQATILSNLGIDATGMTNVQLMDTILGKINGKLITQADLGELVGARIVPAWNRLANEVVSVNEAMDRYRFPLTKEEIEQLDKATAKWAMMKDNISLLTAETALWATKTENALSLAPIWAGPYILILDKIIEKQETARKSAHLFAGFLAGAQADIEARRNFAQNGPFSLPEQTITSSRRAQSQPNRQNLSRYGLPFASDDAVLGSAFSRMRTLIPAPVSVSPFRGMAQDLPTVSRELERSANFTELMAERMRKIEQSGAWAIAQQGAQSLNSVLSLQAQLLQNEITSLDMVSERERRRWQERSDSLRAAGLENSALYRNEQRMFEKAEKVREAKANQLKSKAFEQEKLGRYAQTTMNIATGIVNAWTTPGAAWIAPVLVGLIAATGAAQLATIEAQKNPYHFREGGFVNGSASDNNRVRATGGEFMVEKNSAARNADALRFMNSGGTMQAGGGSVTVIVQGNVVQNDEWVRDSVIPSILKAQRSGVRVFR